MDYATALGKIKKCLALSRSANEHEAAAALRQAQKLMQEHGISDEALQLSDVSTDRSKMHSQAIPQWEVSLAYSVADAFGCDVIIQTEYLFVLGETKKRKNYVFIGVAGAAQIASYAQDVLARQCAKARSAHVAAQPKSCKQSTKTARGDAFAAAWVYAVSSTSLTSSPMASATQRC